MLIVNGYDLNPEPVEAPVLQVTGLNAECIASTLTVSGSSSTNTYLSTWNLFCCSG